MHQSSRQSVWKQAVTKLFHKKDTTDNPKNFRPISLTSSLCKIFTSLVNLRISKFATDNNIINTNYQKGFLSNVSGCLEHSFNFRTVIEIAKRKHKPLYGCLLDLSNAYGSVQHGLILFVLKHYNFPPIIQQLVISMYSNVSSKISTRNFKTQPISNDIGVLQGDPASCFYLPTRHANSH
jgi:hypothetical protein